ELEELEREIAPDLVGLGRYLGLGPKRAVEIARLLDVRTADELRQAILAGRLTSVPGIGPKTEAKLRAFLEREPEERPRRGLLLNRAWELVGRVAGALGGEPAGDPRRFREACERLAVVGPAAEPPPLVVLEDIRGDLHCHTTWSDGKASVLEMAEAALARGYEYLAICDHTPAVGAVPGLDADGLRRQAVEIAEANERVEGIRILRGTECDILPNGRLDLPDSILAELDWVQASVHGGQRLPRAEQTKRVEP